MEMLQLGIDCCCLDEAIGDFIQNGSTRYYTYGTLCRISTRETLIIMANKTARDSTRRMLTRVWFMHRIRTYILTINMIHYILVARCKRFEPSITLVVSDCPLVLKRMFLRKGIIQFHR